MDEKYTFIYRKCLENRTIHVTCRISFMKETGFLENYYQREILEQACKEGCPNYGNKWSCPPFSLPFKKIKGKYGKAILICLTTDMDQYLDIKNKYLAVKAANVTLKNSVEKIARDLEKRVNGYALLSGSCRLCRPCACKTGQSCRHPDQMRYSVEAAYLDVQKMCQDLLDFELLWYNNKVVPLYTSTVSLVLHNKEIEKSQVQEILASVLEC